MTSPARDDAPPAPQPWRRIPPRAYEAEPSRASLSAWIGLGTVEPSPRYGDQRSAPRHPARAQTANRATADARAPRAPAAVTGSTGARVTRVTGIARARVPRETGGASRDVKGGRDRNHVHGAELVLPRPVLPEPVVPTALNTVCYPAFGMSTTARPPGRVIAVEWESR